MNTKDIRSDDFPYKSNYINVQGSRIHYIEEGHGDPILFLHGIPTSNYLWRNVIPWVTDSGRCIAPDLIGLGQSDKPDISYRVFDHINYIESFIDALNLTNMTLVLHGWGSVIGFDYAMQHEDKIKSLVFLESHIRHEAVLQNMSLPLQQLHSELQLVHQDSDVPLDADFYIDKLLHSGVMHPLSEKAVERYHSPFSKEHHHRPLKQYIKDLPFGEYGPRDVVNLINRYSSRLTESNIPKLMLYAIPGFNTTVDTVIWAKNNIKNLKLVDIGEELHYAQETNPHVMGQHIAGWCQSLEKFPL